MNPTLDPTAREATDSESEIETPSTPSIDDPDVVVIDGIRHRSSGGPEQGFIPEVSFAPETQTQSETLDDAHPSSIHNDRSRLSRGVGGGRWTDSQRLRRRGVGDSEYDDDDDATQSSYQPEFGLSTADHMVRCLMVVVVLFVIVYYAAMSLRREHDARRFADLSLPIQVMETEDPYRYVGRLFFSIDEFRNRDDLELRKSVFLQIEDEQPSSVCTAVAVGSSLILTTSECVRSEEASDFDYDPVVDGEPVRDSGRWYFVPQFRVVGAQESLSETSPKGYFPVYLSSTTDQESSYHFAPLQLLRVGRNSLPHVSVQGKSISEVLGGVSEVGVCDDNEDSDDEFSPTTVQIVGYPGSTSDEEEDEDEVGEEAKMKSSPSGKRGVIINLRGHRMVRNTTVLNSLGEDTVVGVLSSLGAGVFCQKNSESRFDVLCGIVADRQFEETSIAWITADLVEVIQES